MAWTNPRTWTDTEFVNAAMMNPHVRDNFLVLGPAAYVRKAADEIVNNSAVLQNDNDFSFAIAANEIWLVTLNLVWTAASATPSIKFGWSVPSGATGHHWGMFFNETTGHKNLDRQALSTPLVPSGSVAEEIITTIWATIVNGANAGTVNFQWAQNTANASNTTLLQNSQMDAKSTS